MSTSHLWALIEEWRDAQLFPVSQAALADKVGITRSAMSQWKKGQATPTPENLRSLSRVTRIQYDRLLEAVVRDMGYMTDEEVGRHGDAAPITPAGGIPAADNVRHFPRADEQESVPEDTFLSHEQLRDLGVADAADDQGDPAEEDEADPYA